MRRLSGPLGGAAETGTLKAAEGDWRKLMSRRRKKRNTDWDNKSMKIQRKYDKYWWEVSVKQEWRNKQIEMKMVVEDVIMIWWDNYHSPKKKTDHWHVETFYLIRWYFSSKKQKKWARHCCDLWAHYCFTVNIQIALSLYSSHRYTGIFFSSSFGFSFLAQCYFRCRSVALKRSDSPKNTRKQN